MLAALYKYLNVAGDLDLTNLDWFNNTKNTKKCATVLEFFNSGKWVTLTKQTGEFLAPKMLKDRFGGLSTMKNFLGINEKLPALERSFKAAVIT